MIALGDGCDAILEGYEQALKSGGAPIVLAERERNLEDVRVEHKGMLMDFTKGLDRTGDSPKFGDT